MSLSTDELYHALAPITVAPHSPRARFTNWGLSFTCTPASVFEPSTEEECALILKLARREGKVVRAAAAGHSPSDLPCTKGFMIRMDKLDRLVKIDKDKYRVVAEGGMTLKKLHQHLDAHGLAMINVGSISDQSIAGAISTATHGSGVNFGCLSTQAVSLDMMLADGSKVHCSKAENEDLFTATCCGLGTTGLILRVELEVEPAFRLRETREVVKFDDMLHDFEKTLGEAEHVRMWWFPQTGLVNVARANRSYETPRPISPNWFWDVLVGYHLVQLGLFIARFFPSLIHYIASYISPSPNQSVTLLDVSHRVFNMDCLFPQYTTEWSIPLHEATSTLAELRTWLDKELRNPNGQRPHFPIEIRVSQEDDIWLSPAYRQTSIWIGIVQYKPYGYAVPYRTLFHTFESILRAHNGRPHWAKTHAFQPSALRELYPKFDDFVRVLEHVDPHGLFRNEYIRRHVFGERGEDVGPRVFKARP